MSKVKWLGQREVSVDNTKIAPPAAIIPTAPVRPSTRTSAASTFRTVSTPSAEETNWPLIVGVTIGLGVLGYVLIKGAKEIGLRDNPFVRGYGATFAETGVFAHEGKEYAAGGAIYDGLVLTGYPKHAGGGWILTAWDGTEITKLEHTGSWRGGFGRGRMHAFAAKFDGKTFTGRNAGEGMFLVMRTRGSKLDDNPGAVWKRFPKTIGKLTPSGFYPKLPVLRVEAFPPGAHPKEGSAIRKDVTLVVAHTQYGPRYFGFAEAYIDSRLTMVVKLLPGQERDEVIAKWQTVKGRG